MVGNRDYVSNLIDFNDSAPSLRLVSLVIIRVIAGYTGFEYIFRAIVGTIGRKSMKRRNSSNN